MRLDYSPGVRRLLAGAQKAAGQYKHRCVHTEYILLGLLESRNAATRLLEDQGFNPNRLKDACKRECETGSGSMKKELRLTHRAEHILELAEEEMRRFGHERLDSRHILLGIVLEPEGTGGSVLREAGVSAEAIRDLIREELSDVRGQTPRQEAAARRPFWKTLLRV